MPAANGVLSLPTLMLGRLLIKCSQGPPCSEHSRTQEGVILTLTVYYEGYKFTARWRGACGLVQKGPEHRSLYLRTLGSVRYVSLFTNLEAHQTLSFRRFYGRSHGWSDHWQSVTDLNLKFLPSLQNTSCALTLCSVLSSDHRPLLLRGRSQGILAISALPLRDTETLGMCSFTIFKHSIITYPSYFFSFTHCWWFFFFNLIFFIEV